MYPAGGDNFALVGNAVDHVENIAPPNVGYLPMLPVREDSPLDRALHHGGCSVLHLIALNPFLENAHEICGTGSVTPRRISPGLNIIARFPPGIMRSFDRHGWV
jgi:hypothetical protein